MTSRIRTSILCVLTPNANYIGYMHTLYSVFIVYYMSITNIAKIVEEKHSTCIKIRLWSVYKWVRIKGRGGIDKNTLAMLLHVTWLKDAQEGA